MTETPIDVTGFSVYFRQDVGECATPKTGKVTGTFPEWLSGTMYRNGPGKMEVGPDQYNHWFDGLSLLHRFTIKDRTATYQSKLLKSETYRKNIKANRIVVSEYGTSAFPDPCMTFYEKFASTFTRLATDNANINIVEYGDGLYAVSEFDIITRVDKTTLDTLEREEIGKYVSVNLATVHPHYEKDGTVYNLGNGFANGLPTDLLIQFPAKPSPGKTPFEEARVVSKIRCGSLLTPSYHHSFSMSENYVVIVDQSFFMDLKTLACNFIRKKAYGSGLQYRADRQVIIKVVDKKTGLIWPTKFETDPFTMFHQTNAYEEDGHIVLDVITFTDFPVTTYFRTNVEAVITHPDQLFKLKTQLKRFVLPMRTPEQCKVHPERGLISLKNTKASATMTKDGKIFLTPEILTEKLDYFELPAINYDNFSGIKYQYAYGVSRLVRELQHGISKVNVDDHSVLEWKSAEIGIMPSEPSFVPRPGSTQEDDGVILFSILHTNDETKTTLVCLDAKSMAQIAVAEFETGVVIPSNAHGRFFPG